MTDPERTAAGLAAVLGLKAADILPLLMRDRGFVYIARKVEPKLGAQVRLLMLKGVDVTPEDKRIYPRGALAPQLLGYVGTENKGLAGIEKQYDDLLKGSAGSREMVRDRVRPQSQGHIRAGGATRVRRLPSPSTRTSSTPRSRYSWTP